MKRPSDLFACGMSCLLLLLANTAAHRDDKHVFVQAHFVESKSIRTAPVHVPRSRHHKPTLASLDAR